MLTGIGLRSFKRFGPDGAFLPLGERVTLLLGPNSSGKSSALQALLLLKQSWPDLASSFTLRPEGGSVRLGTAINLVHLQGEGTAFELAVDFRSGGGRPRRLWIEARPERGGQNAAVERFRLDSNPDRPPVGGAQALGVPAGVLATRSDDAELEWAGQRIVSFELDAGSLPDGLHPLLEEWRTFRERHGLDADDDRFVRVSVALGLHPGQEVTLVRAVLGTRPPEPAEPAPMRPESARPTRGEDEDPAGFVMRLDAYHRKVERWSEERKEWMRQAELVAEDRRQVQAEAPVWEAAEDLVRRIGDPLAEEALRETERPARSDPRWMLVLLPQVIRDVMEAVHRLRYLGPVRDPAVRWVSVGERVDGVGAAGERMVGLLVQDARLIRLDEGWIYEGNLLMLVNRAMGEVGLGYQLEVWGTDPAAGPPSATVRLRQEFAAGTVRVGLLDVGSGIRQVLPVLVEYEHLRAKMGPERAHFDPWILVVEQPELHLHPRLQGDLRWSATWWAPLDVWRFYNDRGDAERVSKTRKRPSDSAGS